MVANPSLFLACMGEGTLPPVMMSVRANAEARGQYRGCVAVQGPSREVFPMGDGRRPAGSVTL